MAAPTERGQRFAVVTSNIQPRTFNIQWPQELQGTEHSMFEVEYWRLDVPSPRRVFMDLSRVQREKNCLRQPPIQWRSESRVNSPNPGMIKPERRFTQRSCAG